jgi:hypothetical protein
MDVIQVANRVVRVPSTGCRSDFFDGIYDKNNPTQANFEVLRTKARDIELESKLFKEMNAEIPTFSEKLAYVLEVYYRLENLKSEKSRVHDSGRLAKSTLEVFEEVQKNTGDASLGDSLLNYSRQAQLITDEEARRAKPNIGPIQSTFMGKKNEPNFDLFKAKGEQTRTFVKERLGEEFSRFAQSHLSRLSNKELKDLYNGCARDLQNIDKNKAYQDYATDFRKDFYVSVEKAFQDVDRKIFEQATNDHRICEQVDLVMLKNEDNVKLDSFCSDNCRKLNGIATDNFYICVNSCKKMRADPQFAPENISKISGRDFCKKACEKIYDNKSELEDDQKQRLYLINLCNEKCIENENKKNGS